ncbi:MAG: hypothetical protein ACRC57_09735 [Sarcina sp.]
MPFEIYLIIAITILILGILCFLKNIKEGFIAACVGGGVVAIIFIIHYIYFVVTTFFKKTGIGVKDIFTYLLCIALTCLGFLTIIAIMKFLGIKKR